jgi:hypothetical protein
MLGSTLGGQPDLDDFRLRLQPMGFKVQDIPVPIHAWYGDRDSLLPGRPGTMPARPVCEVDRLPRRRTQEQRDKAETSTPYSSRRRQSVLDRWRVAADRQFWARRQPLRVALSSASSDAATSLRSCRWRIGPASNLRSSVFR